MQLNYYDTLMLEIQHEGGIKIFKNLYMYKAHGIISFII